MSKLYLFVLLFVVACSSNESKETAQPVPEAAPVVESSNTGTPIVDNRVEEAVAKASEAAPTGESLSSVSCTLNNDTRTIASVAKEGSGGCDVQYTKWGETNVIGGAFNQMEFCTSLIQNVRGNLEAAGFTCQ